jgi:hypothetical protein
MYSFGTCFIYFLYYSNIQVKCYKQKLTTLEAVYIYVLLWSKNFFSNQCKHEKLPWKMPSQWINNNKYALHSRSTNGIPIPINNDRGRSIDDVHKLAYRRNKLDSCPLFHDQVYASPNRSFNRIIQAVHGARDQRLWKNCWHCLPW